MDHLRYDAVSEYVTAEFNASDGTDYTFNNDGIAEFFLFGKKREEPKQRKYSWIAPAALGALAGAFGTAALGGAGYLAWELREPLVDNISKYVAKYVAERRALAESN